jgi:transcriptional regulator with XRE-family HTH domain
VSDPDSQEQMEERIAAGLRRRREELAINVAELASRSGVSRAMISKIERLEARPTAALLGRLCNGLGITLSALIASAERPAPAPVARAAKQLTWRDPETGLRRTMVSPPDAGARVEIVRVELPPRAEVAYEAQRRTFYEQQVVVLEGALTIQSGAETVELERDDCMHMQLDAPIAFANRGRRTCRYLVVVSR